MLTIRDPRRERRRRRWKGRANEERPRKNSAFSLQNVETPLILPCGAALPSAHDWGVACRALMIGSLLNRPPESLHIPLPQHSRFMSTTAPVQTKHAKTKKEKEKEKEREKAERKASLPQQNERLKTVVRRLPPNLPEEIFWNSVQSWVTDETAVWKIYCPGKLRKK